MEIETRISMKILHICNTAGVGSVIAKYTDKLFGTESMVANRRALDPVGLTTYGQLWDNGAKTFAFKCLLNARKFDIVHVHYFDKIIQYLKFLYPKKPLVMHYHGDDIRGKWGLKRKYWNKADVILYSTLDLVDDDTPRTAIYVPNPIDTEIFHTCKVKPKPKTAFHMFYNANDLAEQYAEKLGLELTIHDWRKQGKIPHLKLPSVLCQYEYYVDARRSLHQILLKVPLSKTALEALACGLKVITWDGKIITELPKENHPVSVAKQVFDIYMSVRVGYERLH